MLRLSFTHPAMERDAVRDKYDLLLGVVATLIIEVGGHVLYREPVFPIVELRAQLGHWLEDGLAAHDRFSFRSLESEDPDLLTLTPDENGRWTVAARYQLRPVEVALADSEVRDACLAYVASVDRWVHAVLKIDVDCYL